MHQAISHVPSLRFATCPCAASGARGLSRARNRGLAVSKSDIVAFPDDDCWYLPSTLADAVDRFRRRTGLSVVIGRTIDAAGVDSVSEHLPASQPVTRNTAFLAGNSNAIFARRSALERIGGFDETLGAGAGTRFGSGEETDMILRCLHQGLSVEFDHDFIVHHDQVAQKPGDHERIAKYSAGYGRVARLNRLGLMPIARPIGRASARSLQLLATGDLDGARARWAWISGCLTGYLARPARRLEPTSHA